MGWIPYTGNCGAKKKPARNYSGGLLNMSSVKAEC